MCYYLSDNQVNKIKTSTYTQNKRRIQEKDFCDTLCARDWKDPKCVAVEPKSLITEVCNKAIEKKLGVCVDSPLCIRKLTPKECWRLMGFNDSDFEKAEKVNSNTQLYKQAGNSIVVDVLENIFLSLKSCNLI